MVKFKDQSIFSAFNEKTKIFQEKIYEHALNNEWMSDPYIGFRLKELEKKIDNELILKTNSLGLELKNLKIVYMCTISRRIIVFGSYATIKELQFQNFTQKKLLKKF